LERTTHSNTLWDFAQFEVVGHKWADLSDNSFGLAILNDCKYGWTVKEGHIMPSLLRCATTPNHAQDREVHNFVYSIYPHTGTVNSSDVVKEGYSLNFPLYCATAEPKDGKLDSCYSFVSGDCDNVIIETVKKAEDSKDIVIRVYETWNKQTDCTLSFGDTVKSAVECNLMEDNEGALEVIDNKIKMTFKPFEIKSIKVTL
jgi:alpha-mannosidase